jgi:tetratricopeptide (TPR) repeat protein
LEKHIAKSYNEKYVYNNILKGRIEYYRSAKKWNSYVKYFIRQEDQKGIETWTKGKMHQVFLNDDAYEIFQHSNSRQQLKRALSWVNRALAMDEIRPNPDAMDTKANILYKLGRKEEGLLLEEQTHNLSPRNRAITANYEKMKNGLPTWVLD